MAPVPPGGLATSAPLFGHPGRRLRMVNEVGGDVEVMGDMPGHASAPKVMRSIVTKGLTALIIESLESAA